MDNLTRLDHNDITQAEPPRLVFDPALLAGQLGESSIRVYRRDVAAYLAFARDARTALGPTTLVRWRTHLVTTTTKSPNTINRMLSSVRSFVSRAAKAGQLAPQVAEQFQGVDGVKIRALRDRTRTTARTRVSPGEMHRICSAPDGATLIGCRDLALLQTMAASALRAGELATLRLDQIRARDGGFVLLVAGKTDDAPREAPLSPKAKALIDAWVAARPVESDFIFTAFAGRGDSRLTARPMSTVSVWRTVQRYAKVAGLAHVKPHDFRRFVGTQLARRDIRQAQKALGHKRIDTTARHYVLDELTIGLTDDLF